MPIKIIEGLPAKESLAQEKIYTIDESRAKTQDIRPLKILILNLMPKKEVTEVQLLRLLGNSPLQVDVDFIHSSTHTSKNTHQSHLSKFYMTFDQVRDQFFDGMIVTGAPVETLPFDQVDYFEELKAIFEWSKSHVYSTAHICWGAQAALYYHFGIDKVQLDHKLFGIFPAQINHKGHPIIRGFDDCYQVPQSRHTNIRLDQLEERGGALDILSLSPLFGPDIMASKDKRQLYILGHLEYDRETLAQEYFRDLEAGENPRLPKNYFPENDPKKKPPFTWRAHANLIYYNWLNFVYQATPYELEKIKDLPIQV
ncbi:MAG: homoserine O-succinyltransferase [Tissierellia bacterium]|nr:homoserine O-succinyltransferase [Tissierellia bacterium]